MNVPKGKNALVFSCIGYKEQTITLKPGQRTLNVRMAEDTELLDEVVVVGYGTMKKSDLTGSVTSIDVYKRQRLRGQSHGYSYW